MKKIFLGLLASSISLLSMAQQNKFVKVSSKSEFQRTELISIPFKKFTSYFNLKDTVFSIVDQVSGNVVPHQLEKRGSSQVQNVLVLVSILKDQDLRLNVVANASPIIPSRTYARYIPERFDDFAWENDLVAFRLYGKALEGRKDDAQGMDYWAKRTSNLIINSWYKTDDYHVDHGEGLDYYSVGQTLGVGDIAAYPNQQIQYTKHYREFEILDNGPLRTTFKLSFEPEKIAGQELRISKTISLDAGSQFNRIEVLWNNASVATSDVVIGLARRKESNPQVFFNAENNSLTYWEPEEPNKGITGTALILPSAKAQYIDSDASQFLISTQAVNKKPLVYYNGAAWNKAGKITSFEEWKIAVSHQAEQIKYPLTITFN